MIWVSLACLAVGALLAQRFRIAVLLPATLAVAVLAFGAATTQVESASSTTLIIIVTCVSMQAGYFVGMLVRRRIGGASRLSSFLRERAANTLRRARKLPAGPYRNDLRQ
jgi:hypothetical protein